MSAESAAMRGFLLKKGEAAPDNLTTSIVVNVRPIKGLLEGDFDGSQMHNNFGAIIFKNDLRDLSPRARLASTRQRTDALKNSPEASFMNKLMGVLPMEVVEKSDEDMKAKRDAGKLAMTMNCSNVIGPREPFTFAGQDVSNIFNSNTTDNYGPAGILAFFSCYDTMNVNFATSHVAKADLELFLDLMRDELDALLAATETEQPLSYGGCSKCYYILLLPFAWAMMLFEFSLVLVLVVLGLTFALVKTILCCPCTLVQKIRGETAEKDVDSENTTAGLPKSLDLEEGVAI